MRLANRLARFTALLRRVARLALPFFHSDARWPARGLLAAIVALNLAAVYMLVQINSWNRVFYDALQERNQAVFWDQLGRFTLLAFAYIVIAVYKFYLTQLLELRWRGWMTQDLLARWLQGQAYYRLELARFTRAEAGSLPDNPDQRLQEDVHLFTTHTVNLAMGLLNAVVTLASFVGILWGLSGAFTLSAGGQDWRIPGFMVWMALLYAIAGSWLTHHIGRPLIELNFRQQRREADFRHHMVRLREYSESIALDRGEAVERGQLGARFGAVLDNTLALMRAQKRLLWFTTGFGQAAVVFPFLVAAPRYFSGAIQLGELMQIASAFGRVQDALAWFVDNYDTLASWQATTDRLTGFEASLQASRGTLTGATAASDAPESGVPEARDLWLALPDGAVLLAGESLRVAPGEPVLVRGPSGSGKSTLLRALAGIWPCAGGTVRLPAHTRFLPQRPYFPNGPLRDALAYPDPPGRHDDAALRAALRAAQLPALVDRLDEADAWNQKLSGGEQQRLAIARVLLHRPAWVFADEATSALDPATERTLTEALVALTAARGGTLVSVAHRPALAAHHRVAWTFEPAPSGAPARWHLRREALTA